MIPENLLPCTAPLLRPHCSTLKADFAINRRDFNINYPGKPNDLIRDNVVMKLDIKATPGVPRPEDQISTTATAQAR